MRLEGFARNQIPAAVAIECENSPLTVFVKWEDQI